jgi:hypothetical protein
MMDNCDKAEVNVSVAQSNLPTSIIEAASLIRKTGLD